MPNETFLLKNETFPSIFVHCVTRKKEIDRNGAQFPRGNQNVTNSLGNTKTQKKLKCFGLFRSAMLVITSQKNTFVES